MTTTALSFEELFRLAFEEPVTWLSAESSKRGSVNWVVTSLSDVQDGDILLLNGEQIDVDVLTQVKESNVGCVLILGELESLIENLPENFPAAHAAGQRNVRTTHRILATVLANQRAALMERGVRVHAQLSQLAAEAEGLEVIARAIADISGRAVLVQDKRGNTLAEHPSTDLSEIWGDMLKQLNNFEDLPEPLRDIFIFGQSILWL